jgi:hypothetical protein
LAISGGGSAVHRKLNRALASIGLAAGLAISLSTVANATPVLLGTTTNPSGINNLVVDGTIYDVTLSTTALNTFSYGSTLSNDAATSLASALNALSVTGLGALTPTIENLINVDNSLSNFSEVFCLTVTAPGCAAGGQWSVGHALGAFTLGLSSDQSFYVEAADFSAVGPVPTNGVPEPSTLALFPAGLAALLMLRRDRNALFR